MTGFVSYSTYSRELALNETFESYVELRRLARDVFAAYRDGRLRQGKIYPITDFKKRDYVTIGGIFEANIGVFYQEKEGRDDAYGSFMSPKLDKHGNRVDVSSTTEYGDGVLIVHKLNVPTILHELEHAYDSFRSGGKFTVSRGAQDFFAEMGKNRIVGRDEIPNIVDKRRKLYYRAPHELSAFFVQAVDGIDFFYDEAETVFRDFRDVHDEFKEKMKGYKYLTPKIQRDLARKLSQYYYRIREGDAEE